MVYKFFHKKTGSGAVATSKGEVSRNEKIAEELHKQIVTANSIVEDIIPTKNGIKKHVDVSEKVVIYAKRLFVIILAHTFVRKFNKILLTRAKYFPELHLNHPVFTYSACRPFMKHRERIQKFRETGNLKHLYENELDKACFNDDPTFR